MVSREVTAKTAAALAEAIAAVGKSARTEEDVRVGVSIALEPVLKGLGLNIQPLFEAGGQRGDAATGRRDAVYGAVIFEYKAAGRLKSTPERAKATEQLKGYLGLTPKGRSERVVGVLTDARTIIFVRKRPSRREAVDVYPLDETAGARDGWYVTAPLPISGDSIAQLLHFLRALSREPLTAVALGKSFGPAGSLAPSLVAALYARLQEPSPLTQTLYAEWDRIFGIVYGQDVRRAATGAKALGDLYSVPNADLKPLFFAVQTYYALVMKLLAVEVASLQQGSYITSFVQDVLGLDDAQFDQKVEALEDGSEFRRLEITNYLEGDFFRWYLAEWDSDLRDLIRTCVRTLEQFEPGSGYVEPEQARDLLKHLYEHLVPKRLRHDLGEYYTPDWLADFVLDQAGYDGNPDVRLLDPACGSGTFPALEIGRAIAYGEDHLLEQKAVAKSIVANIVAFDLNPVAVLAARTTYLLSLGHLIRYVRPLEIPVYLCDSILLPAEEGGGLLSRGRRMRSSVGPFVVPEAIDTGAKMSRFAEALERAVRENHSNEGLRTTVERSLGSLSEPDRTLLTELYTKLVKLAAEGRNGIWPRIIKNNFAPVFLAERKFDYVVGNPPWVNWESLSDEYRRATRDLWQDYGLFSLSGHSVRLGGGKKDLSMLMTYAAADHYLRPGGTLSFLITQTVFKSEDAGRGFRQFSAGPELPLGVRSVHDFSALQPFAGASNRTALLTLIRDQRTEYPVRWVQWQAKGSRRPSPDSTLESVMATTSRDERVAVPVEGDDPSSPWLTAHEDEIPVLRGGIGSSEYSAHAGSYTGGLNGAFWVRVEAHRTDGTVLIHNVTENAKTITPEVEAVVEPDLIYPLLRGKDVRHWRGNPSGHILLAQDPVERIGLGEPWMRDNLPLTYAYLSKFKSLLKGRASQVVQDLMTRGAFYSMYGIGQYTMSPWKVVWREQATAGQEPDLVAAAVGPASGRPVIPDHKLSMVACESAEEAHYLSAVLNSSLPGRIVAAYALAVGISTNVIDYVRIPRFDPSDPLHAQIAAIGSRAYEGEVIDSGTLDELIARLWRPRPGTRAGSRPRPS